MREECVHFQSRTYASGEAARFCRLDLAPEAPWRCPENCPSYRRRLADVGWVHGSLVEPAHRGRARCRRAGRGRALGLGRGHRQRRGAGRARRGPGRGRPQGAGRQPVVAPEALSFSGPVNGSGGRRSMKAVMASTRSSEASIPAFQVATYSSPSATVRPSLAASTDLVPCTAMGELAAISPPVRPRPPARLGVGGHVVDQPDLLGPCGVDVLAGEGQLGQVPGADDGGQALEAPEVGHDRHLGLAYREDGVGRGQADVAGRDEVDAAADAVAVHGRDDRLRALRPRRRWRPAGAAPRCGRCGPGRPWRAMRRSPPPVLAPAASRPPMALRSSPTEKWGPRAATTTTRTSVSSLTTCMARGRSRQRSGPMALRASGRSSHTVATASCCSMLRTGEAKVVCLSHLPQANRGGKDRSGWPLGWQLAVGPLRGAAVRRSPCRPRCAGTPI